MMHHMTTPPSFRHSRVRVTVPVTTETLEAFQHYADSAGISVGRAMADWLAEQLNAVTYAALRLEEVREEIREAPRAVARAVVPEQLQEAAGRPGGPRSRGSPGRPQAGLPPRPVIRGGNSPKGELK
jgi:hypothetical protein